MNFNVWINYTTLKIVSRNLKQKWVSLNFLSERNLLYFHAICKESKSLVILKYFGGKWKFFFTKYFKW